jgi:hypothetical protein
MNTQMDKINLLETGALSWRPSDALSLTSGAIVERRRRHSRRPVLTVLPLTIVGSGTRRLPSLTCCRESLARDLRPLHALTSPPSSSAPPLSPAVTPEFNENYMAHITPPSLTRLLAG